MRLFEAPALCNLTYNVCFSHKFTVLVVCVSYLLVTLLVCEYIPIACHASFTVEMFFIAARSSSA